MEFCDQMLQKFTENEGLLDNILWTDEAEFKLNGTINRHNSVVWSTTNPHYQLQVRNSHQGVMVWCGVNSVGLVGPHFFDGNVNAQSYLQVLEGC